MACAWLCVRAHARAVMLANLWAFSRSCSTRLPSLTQPSLLFVFGVCSMQRAPSVPMSLPRAPKRRTHVCARRAFMHPLSLAHRLANGDRCSSGHAPRPWPMVLFCWAVAAVPRHPHPGPQGSNSSCSYTTVASSFSFTRHSFVIRSLPAALTQLVYPRLVDLLPSSEGSIPSGSPGGS